jgi:hypothetical protein
LAKALVITEKPSVARDITAVFGGFTDHDGYFENDDYVVTFAVGHLYELLPPEEVDEKYKRWTLDVLPILPEQYRYKPKKGQRDRRRPHRQRLRRGPRGRAHLPRDRRQPRLEQAHPAPLAPVDDRRGDSRSRSCGPVRSSRGWPTPPPAARSPTGSSA